MAAMDLVVIDPAGLHARPAAQFVRTASRFTSRITITSGERSADAKSLISLLGLVVRPQSVVTLVADGPDADDALAALVDELGAAAAPAPLTDAHDGTVVP
jgi:phosphotransferase system HPr (HPr) family protein